MPELLAGELVMDYGLYPRTAISSHHVNELADAIRPSAPCERMTAAVRWKPSMMARVEALMTIGGNFAPASSAWGKVR